MTSTPKTYTFMYAAQKYEIPSTGKEQFKEIIIKFLEIFNKDAKIHDYNYYYKGKLIVPILLTSLLVMIKMPDRF